MLNKNDMELSSETIPNANQQKALWEKIVLFVTRHSVLGQRMLKCSIIRSDFFHHQDPSQDQGAERAPGQGTGLCRNPRHKPHAREGFWRGAPVHWHQPPEQLCEQRTQPAAQPPRRLSPHPSSPPAPALRFPLHPSQQSPQRPAPVCRQVGADFCTWIGLFDRQLVFGVSHTNGNFPHSCSLFQASQLHSGSFSHCCFLYVVPLLLITEWITFQPPPCHIRPSQVTGNLFTSDSKRDPLMVFQ